MFTCKGISWGGRRWWGSDLKWEWVGDTCLPESSLYVRRWWGFYCNMRIWKKKRHFYLQGQFLRWAKMVRFCCTVRVGKRTSCCGHSPILARTFLFVSFIFRHKKKHWSNQLLLCIWNTPVCTICYIINKQR